MCKKTQILFAILVANILLLSSCGSENVVPQDDKNDVLVSVGDSTLTLRDVLRQMPRGLNPDDSIALFNQIVESWVKELVLADVAEKNITDMSHIERLVDEYRNNLILNEYLSTMSAQSAPDIDENRIREYYEQNKEDMILEQPIIKGAFLKVSDSDPSIANLRKWMSQFSEVSLDNIEKSGLRQASQYKYFKDEWHEFSSVAEQIPYRFYDADAFVSSTRDFETQEGGSIYLLHISQYEPSGKQMPYDFAKLKIQEILHARDLKEYKNNLVKDIYSRQIKEGHLRPGKYNPLTREYKK